MFIPLWLAIINFDEKTSESKAESKRAYNQLLASLVAPGPQPYSKLHLAYQIYQSGLGLVLEPGWVKVMPPREVP